MGKFIGFDDPLHFFCFLTQVIYNIIPCFFLYQLHEKAIRIERISIIGIVCLYFNAFIYFWTSVYHYDSDSIKDINPLDFCNLIGFYLGFIDCTVYFYLLYFSKDKKKFFIPVISLIIISLIFFIIIYKYINEEENTCYKIFNWYIGTIFNILENLPLGFNIIYLIKNKISERFTLFAAFPGIVNTIIWLIWAIKKVVKEDEEKYYSIVANSIGICLHILQFSLYLIFKKDEDSEENSTEIPINSNIEIEEKAKSKENETIEDFM